MSTLLDLSLMFAPMPVGPPLAHIAPSTGTQVHCSLGVSMGIPGAPPVPVGVVLVVPPVEPPAAIAPEPEVVPPLPPFPPVPPFPPDPSAVPPHAARARGANTTRREKR